MTASVPVTATTSPKRYTAGDPCPMPKDAPSRGFTYYSRGVLDRVEPAAEPAAACGKLLESRRSYWGSTANGFRCPNYHEVVQCVRCSDFLPQGSRDDARYCGTKCRVYALRERRRNEAAAAVTATPAAAAVTQ